MLYYAAGSIGCVVTAASCSSSVLLPAVQHSCILEMLVAQRTCRSSGSISPFLTICGMQPAAWPGLAIAWESSKQQDFCVVAGVVLSMFQLKPQASDLCFVNSTGNVLLYVAKSCSSQQLSQPPGLSIVEWSAVLWSTGLTLPHCNVPLASGVACGMSVHCTV